MKPPSDGEKMWGSELPFPRIFHHIIVGKTSLTAKTHFKVAASMVAYCSSSFLRRSSSFFSRSPLISIQLIDTTGMQQKKVALSRAVFYPRKDVVGIDLAPRRGIPYNPIALEARIFLRVISTYFAICKSEIC
jgi:hypothetical protein